MEQDGAADHGAGGGGGGGGGGDMQLLLSILADGEEQARLLVGDPPDDDGGRLSTGRAEELGECCCRGAAVARQLRRSLAKAVAVAKAIEAAGGVSGSRGTDRSDSPRSADESSGGVDARAHERHGTCKRRKGLPRWTQKFRMPDANLEYTPEDGFSWRKYGQKDILGAKFPRAYYRCTYRNGQGCQATRQVQRSDADVAVFDVTYQGAHTCHQKQQQRHATSPSAAAAAAMHDGGDGHSLPDQQDLQLLASFKNCLKVETDGLAASASAPPSFHGQLHEHDSTAAFSFDLPSAPPSFHDAAGFSPVGSGRLPGGCFSASSSSPPFVVSPVGSSYFSVSPAGHCPAVGTRVGAEPATTTELGEVVSAATAAPAAVDPAGAGFDYSPLYQYHAELDDPHLPFAPTAFSHPPHGHGHHYFGDW